MSSESDTPDAGGARSGGPRAPRRAPAKAAGTASASTGRAPVKRTAAKKPSTPVKPTTPAKPTTARRPSTAAKPVPADGPEVAAAATSAPAPARKKPAAPRKPVQRKTAATTAAAAPESDVVEAPPTTAPGDESVVIPAIPAPVSASAPDIASAPDTVPAPAARTPRVPRTPRKPRTAVSTPPLVVRDIDPNNIVLSISGLMKKFGSTTAVAGIDIDVPQGSFYGIVGPNGAGKTTTLSMVTGLLRPDGGTITVLEQDVWRDPASAKRLIGVLPDRLRLFDRLTGRQLLYYSGTLRGLDSATVAQRSDDLAVAFGLEDALGRLVSDYSAGMTKKIALACSMIHSPRILVLDEPFESVDPVSAANVVEILQKYVSGGGTVVLSSHSMDMIQRVCDRVAIIVEGQVLAKGTVDEVRDGGTLEQRFVELAGGRKSAEGMEWLLSSSD
ncbi:ATP-binding cassette domain-containing protein [Herbiconiux sp. CPCC 205763]|uniref:ATP-binding cassette domain-containing protein n=1 Tax=Herbiconiux aconitum TaxID=2970913 RepID=A0ABT2GSK0_9MICO|nr:ATP-binding cassette domain-containing protein [Herbiconiux aconitum]MCS5719204.1 ATP-binding cassette domain-containing protein [Herbiconiux aconitum]